MQGAHGEDDFLDSLRRAAERPSGAPPSAPGRPSDPSPRAIVDAEPATQAAPLVTSRAAEALRELEERIAGLEREVRVLNESRDEFVSDIADAVIARLDARWARALAADERTGG